MKKRTIFALLVSLFLGALSISVSAQPSTHSVWTNANGATIKDPNGCTYTNFSSFNMATSWTEPFNPTNAADAHFRGVGKAIGSAFGPCPTRFYDFRLVSSIQTKSSSIEGYWDIYRAGVLVCSSCYGTATDIDKAAGAGNFYELYVDDPFFGPQAWLYSGYIDQRKDF
jgi:hypothetical protein